MYHGKTRTDKNRNPTLLLIKGACARTPDGDVLGSCAGHMDDDGVHTGVADASDLLR
jgi:hypothetical protein